MKSSALTPEESLLLITKTIEETKERFKENGHVFVFWGTLMLIVIGSQFILSILELYKFTMYPVFLYPIGAIITGIYVRKEYKKNNAPKTIIGDYYGKPGMGSWDEPFDNGISIFCSTWRRLGPGIYNSPGFDDYRFRIDNQI